MSLVYPKRADFERYDIFLGVYEPNSVPILYGYQLKGQKLPTSGVTEGVASFVLRSADMNANTGSLASKNGWTIVKKKERDSFLGSTFFPLRWMESGSPESEVVSLFEGLTVAPESKTE